MVNRVTQRVRDASAVGGCYKQPPYSPEAVSATRNQTAEANGSFALCPDCDLVVRFGKPICPDCRVRFRAFHRLDAEWGSWRAMGEGGSGR